MDHVKVSRLVMALLAISLSFSVHPAAESAAASHPRPAGKMKMETPMAGGMARKGMKKGDVKRAADRKLKTMQPMIEQEQQSMPPAPRKN
ncbi:MAG: hypothetical protein HYU74_01720 [Dechloromonas sp.]|nr:hypothetical protein [Dechloromonas sp.]